MFERVLKRRESKLGPGHPDTLSNCNTLAFAYGAVGRWAPAEVLRRENLAQRRKAVKPYSPLLAVDLAGFGTNLLKQSRWSEAEPVLRESLALLEQTHPDDWTRFITMSRLGEALSGQGRYAEAEPLVVQGYEGLKARAAKLPPPGKIRLPEAAERVIRLYEAWGRPDEAVGWKSKLGLADLPADVFAAP
jgi:hypothetical protein